MRKNRVYLLGVVTIVLLFLLVKGILFWTAKPKVTVDYVAEYNKLTQPQDYDPNKNAADDYQEALDAFMEMPKEVSLAISRPSFELSRQLYKKRNERFTKNSIAHRADMALMSNGNLAPNIDWPTDFNNDEQDMLRRWLASNEKAFECFRIASHKPYYWLERGSREDIGMSGMMFPETWSFRDLIETMIWNAKLKAADGQFQSAFDDILACYRAGQQKCQTRSILFEQLLGITIKDRALSVAISIIDRVDMMPENLIIFQNALETEFKNDTYVIDCEAERLKLYDVLQRAFVYNRKGNGRLAWCKVVGVFSMCLPDETIKMKYNLFLDCLLGPTRNEMAQYIEETFAAFDSVKYKTPWQLHIKNENYFQQLSVPQKSRYFKKFNLSGCGDCEQFALGIFSEVSPIPFNEHYRLKAKEGALLAIIAIQRFRAEKGKLPATLDELVSAGYLQTLPLDPYSDGL